MKITEKQLLDGYDGITKCGCKISIVSGHTIYWEYRREHDEGAAVCDVDRADIITLENDRVGNIPLSVPSHPAIKKIRSDEQKLYGAEVSG